MFSLSCSLMCLKVKRIEVFGAKQIVKHVSVFNGILHFLPVAIFSYLYNDSEEVHVFLSGINICMCSEMIMREGML